MSIGPIELNGGISRAQDFSIIKQNEDNKGMLDQGNIHNQFAKEVKDKSSQVHQADNADNDEYRYDPREKGNGQYSENKKNKKKEKKAEGKVVMKGQSRFDIKI